MKTSIKFTMASLSIIAAMSCTSVANAQTFNVVNQGDFGEGHQNFPPSNATDGNTNFASRWAGNFVDGDGDANLFVDFGSVQRVDDIGVAWGRGDRRSYNFEVRARSGTSGSWTKIRDRADSSGDTTSIEVYNVDDFDARQVRIKVFSNSANTNWADVTEFEVYGTSGPSGGNSSSSTSSTSTTSSTSSSSTSSSSSSGDFGLNPNADPWDNFDLSEWRLDTPAGEDSASDCDAQTTDPQDWENNFPSRSEPYFFTHSDGGMRFVTRIGGGTTGGSCNSRTRSELREMLRGTNTNIDAVGDDGDFRNNWALEYQPNNADADETWGARGGKMSATLRVNSVTTSGSDSSRGRVVIGQIHASDDEPLRLNYKHRAGFSGGCVYAASEQRGGDDTNFVLIGNNTSCSQDPGSDGIALGELFSYEIENVNEDIIVTIRRGDRDGSVINSVRIDLDEIDAGYDRDDEWNYFKAGAYTQNSINDGGSSGDGDVVTFYRLDVEH